MNKSDVMRFQFTLLQKLGVTGGWVDKIDGDGVCLHLTWGAIEKILSSAPTTKEEIE